VKEDEQFYGYGGHLIAEPTNSELTRDRVAAIYKLSRTGSRPTMKFGNEKAEGKQSIPGSPVVFRRRHGDGPLGLVGQEGEVPPPGYFLLTGSAPENPSLVGSAPEAGEGSRVAHSPATRALVEQLKASRPRALQSET